MRRATYCLICLAVGATCSFLRPAQAQFSAKPALSMAVSIETSERSSFVQADELLSDGQWEEAVEKLQQLIVDEGDRLAIQTEDDAGAFIRYLPVRDTAFLKLAATHFSQPEVLALYRRRVDPLAKRWFQQAVEQRKLALLEQLVDQLFVSSYGDDALLRLGEAALERAEYARARDCWQRISPLLCAPSDPSRGYQTQSWWRALQRADLHQQWAELEPLMTQPRAATRWLAYPDTDVDLAEVRARLVLVSILEGSPVRARFELELLRRLHPGAEGRIAGRTGVYADLLAALLKESESWPKRPAPADWTTFAGSPNRNQHAARGMDIRPRPIWQLELQPVSLQHEVIGMDRPRIAEGQDGALSYHPLVLGELLLWNSSDAVFVHRLHDSESFWGVGADADRKGTAAWELYPGNRLNSGPSGEMQFSPRRGHVGSPRFTMSAHGQKLFARLGDPVTGSRDDDEDRAKTKRGFLIGLDLEKQASVLSGFPLYPGRDVRWEFEGAPISDGSKLYVAMRNSSQQNASTELHVACFSLPTVPEADDQYRRPLWRVKICSAQTAAGVDWDEITSNLLSLHDGTLFCNTNMGAVAAVSADDGRIKWVLRYPRSPLWPSDPDQSDLHYFRDLNPCLCHQDLVVVAPADCDRILAVDGGTGQLIWETLNVDAVHLLGAAHGKLIASGISLYWFDLNTGRVAAQFPSPGTSPANGLARRQPSGYGRGILGGGQVYWPTRGKIFVFEQQLASRVLSNGSESLVPEMRRQPIELRAQGGSGGNLTIAGNSLIITSANRLAVYEE